MDKKMRAARAFLLGFLCWGFWGMTISSGAAAENRAALEGRILDSQGNPQAGAVVYLYDSPSVKRPADFASQPTAADGRYRLEALSGRYWAVAVWRKGGSRLGPLTLDDKHSGEPQQIELPANGGLAADFVVRDLREAARTQEKRGTDMVMVSGRIVDSSGMPLAMAYAVADASPTVSGVPAYLSTWTGADGKYILYVPKGRFHFGAAEEFPPGPGLALPVAVECREDQSSVDIVIAKTSAERKPPKAGASLDDDED